MADPAFRGFVESTLDALLVFEGCKRGYLPKISRRLQDYEKRALVVSGAVFVFDEEETGIKRWTDGMSWSPSRTLGNFLVYRELDKKAANAKDEDDEAAAAAGLDRSLNGAGGALGNGTGSSNRLMGGLTSKSDPVDDANDLAPIPSTSTSFPSGMNRQRSMSEAASSLQLDRARERALVGSLTSSYRFRSDGLVKKTISLSGLHLIGYYRIDDVTSGRLRTPSSHPELMSLEVSSDFLTPSLFRMPPVVEVGPDGQLRYKGESDAPISPLTRSGSSQGFPTPNLTQSRPSSSDPYSCVTSAHFTPLLGNRPPSRDYPSAPGSPRRGATATFRSTNRFDPYSVGRYSPNAAPYAPAGGYPFPNGSSASQPSPHRATFPTIGELPTNSTGADYQKPNPAMYDQRPATHSGEVMTNSAQVQGMWYGTNGGSNQSTSDQAYQELPTGRGSFASEGSAPTATGGYYQPRHATPYQPSTSEASTSTAIFAYNPPPAGLAQRRGSEVAPSSLSTGYPQQQLYAAPPRPPSQQYQGLDVSGSNRNHQLAVPSSNPTAAYPAYSPSTEPTHSPYETSTTPASTARSQYPFPSSSSIAQNSAQPLHSRAPTGLARPSPVPTSLVSPTGGWTGLDLGSTQQLPSDSTSHLLPQQSAHLVDLSNGGGQRSPTSSAHDRQYEYVGVYPTSSASSSSTSPAYAYDTLHQPSGLVVGLSHENLVGAGGGPQHSVQGLGVGIGIGGGAASDGSGQQSLRQGPTTSMDPYQPQARNMSTSSGQSEPEYAAVLRHQHQYDSLSSLRNAVQPQSSSSSVAAVALEYHRHPSPSSACPVPVSSHHGYAPQQPPSRYDYGVAITPGPGGQVSLGSSAGAAGHAGWWSGQDRGGEPSWPDHHSGMPMPKKEYSHS
ncbi:hypothetical protein JCM10212_003359 [Sporobolomyces blumeae]